MGRLEVEKEELQAALEEAEGALEQEENKVLRASLELGQVRQEIDRRIAEKEEEFENSRKNHARAMDSMQASLESEQRAKAEALRMKKKLEGDINELEIALDHANKANSEAQKAIKRYQGQMREEQCTLCMLKLMTCSSKPRIQRRRLRRRWWMLPVLLMNSVLSRITPTLSPRPSVLWRLSSKNWKTSLLKSTRTQFVEEELPWPSWSLVLGSWR